MAYFTRSRARTEHRAAGVLPFCLYDDAVLVLLGAENCRTGPGGKVWRLMWRDFGGQREAVDMDSAATAAREFAEETLGLFGACGVDAASVALAAAAMEARLRTPGAAIKVVHELKHGEYHFWCTQQPFVAPLMLRLATQQNAATGAVEGAEKSAFAWVPLKALLECVAVAQPRYFLRCQAHVCGGEGTPAPGKAGVRQFQLHPVFACSPYGAYTKGGSETGLLGGMGSQGTGLAPGATADVKARLAQETVGPEGSYALPPSYQPPTPPRAGPLEASPPSPSPVTVAGGPAPGAPGAAGAGTFGVQGAVGAPAPSGAEVPASAAARQGSGGPQHEAWEEDIRHGGELFPGASPEAGVEEYATPKERAQLEGRAGGAGAGAGTIPAGEAAARARATAASAAQAAQHKGAEVAERAGEAAHTAKEAAAGTAAAAQETAASTAEAAQETAAGAAQSAAQTGAQLAGAATGTAQGAVAAVKGAAQQAAQTAAGVVAAVQEKAGEVVQAAKTKVVGLAPEEGVTEGAARKTGEAAEAIESSAADTAAAARDKAAGAAQGLSETAGSAAERARAAATQYAESAKAKGSELAGQARTAATPVVEGAADTAAATKATAEAAGGVSKAAATGLVEHAGIMLEGARQAAADAATYVKEAGITGVEATKTKVASALPESVQQTYQRGQQLAAEKDAEQVVCVPASAVKEAQGGASATGAPSAPSGAAGGGAPFGGAAGGTAPSGAGGGSVGASQVAKEVREFAVQTQEGGMEAGRQAYEGGGGPSAGSPAAGAGIKGTGQVREMGQQTEGSGAGQGAEQGHESSGTGMFGTTATPQEAGTRIRAASETAAAAMPSRAEQMVLEEHQTDPARAQKSPMAKHVREPQTEGEAQQ
ncbi:Cytochrome c oxidase subunit 6b [Micractinium conductrix]|uniref:Cytochrome c oxidase subunit 6b n=1 Tax=Micractinium conductrix TaxID=554055 RepID=A0A2P6V7N1_9CHLO|nr:Cytochrome c oxidase subunit 6b [Micractinium conductrix]|eukprot:PSC70091.1 Cytochrome c oxidase subunit 6b [Micractinium conductrix]